MLYVMYTDHTHVDISRHRQLKLSCSINTSLLVLNYHKNICDTFLYTTCFVGIGSDMVQKTNLTVDICHIYVYALSRT